MDTFYDWIEGDFGGGHAQNPTTGLPYHANVVPAGLLPGLAEFWADGPDSETPPGHWFVLLNGAMDRLTSRPIGWERGMRWMPCGIP